MGRLVGAYGDASQRLEPSESRLLEFHFPRVRANCGAGAFACQPRARPVPLAWIRCQAGAYRVVLHIVNDTVQLRFIAHTMVEGFILPKGSPRSIQDQVGFSRRGTFQPTSYHRQGSLRQQQYMNVVGIITRARS